MDGAAPVMVTVVLAGANPGADALMFTDPRLRPDTCGCVVGVVDPPGMNTIPGATLTLDESLLVRVTLTPPGGAGVPN